MNMKAVFLALFLQFFFVESAIADFTVEQYLSFKGTEEKFDHYLVGLGRGIFWTNTLLDASGREKVFCVPDELALDKGIILAVIDQEIRNPKGRESWEPDANIELIAVLAFKNKFPCPIRSK